MNNDDMTSLPVVREEGDGQPEVGGKEDAGQFKLVHFKAPQPKIAKTKKAKRNGDVIDSLTPSQTKIIAEKDFEDLAQSMKEARGSTYAIESVVESPGENRINSNTNCKPGAVEEIATNQKLNRNDDRNLENELCPIDGNEGVNKTPASEKELTKGAAKENDDDAFVNFIEDTMKKSWREARRASLEVNIDEQSDLARMSDLESERAPSSRVSVSGADDMPDVNEAGAESASVKRPTQIGLEAVLNELDEQRNQATKVTDNFPIHLNNINKQQNNRLGENIGLVSDDEKIRDSLSEAKNSLSDQKSSLFAPLEVNGNDDTYENSFLSGQTNDEGRPILTSMAIDNLQNALSMQTMHSDSGLNGSLDSGFMSTGLLSPEQANHDSQLIGNDNLPAIQKAENHKNDETATTAKQHISNEERNSVPNMIISDKKLTCSEKVTKPDVKKISLEENKSKRNLDKYEILSPLSGDESCLISKHAIDQVQIDSGIGSDYTTDCNELTDSEAFSPRCSRQYEPIISLISAPEINSEKDAAKISNIAASNDVVLLSALTNVSPSVIDRHNVNILLNNKDDMIKGINENKISVKFQPDVTISDSKSNDENGNAVDESKSHVPANNTLQESANDITASNESAIRRSEEHVLDSLDEQAELEADSEVESIDSCAFDQSNLSFETSDPNHLVADWASSLAYAESSMVQVDVIGERVIVSTTDSDEAGSQLQEIVKEKDSSVGTEGEVHAVHVIGLQPIGGGSQGNSHAPSESGISTNGDKMFKADNLEESRLTIEVKPWNEDPRRRVMKAEIVEKVDLGKDRTSTRRFIDQDEGKDVKRTRSESGVNRLQDSTINASRMRSASSGDRLDTTKDTSQKLKQEVVTTSDELQKLWKQNNGGNSADDNGLVRQKSSDDGKKKGWPYCWKQEVTVTTETSESEQKQKTRQLKEEITTSIEEITNIKQRNNNNRIDDDNIDKSKRSNEKDSRGLPHGDWKEEIIFTSEMPENNRLKQKTNLNEKLLDECDLAEFSNVLEQSSEQSKSRNGLKQQKDINKSGDGLNQSTDFSKSDDDMKEPSGVSKSGDDMKKPNNISKSDDDMKEPSGINKFREDLKLLSDVGESGDSLKQPSDVNNSSEHLKLRSDVGESDDSLKQPNKISESGDGSEQLSDLSKSANRPNSELETMTSEDSEASETNADSVTKPQKGDINADDLTRPCKGGINADGLTEPCKGDVKEEACLWNEVESAKAADKKLDETAQQPNEPDVEKNWQKLENNLSSSDLNLNANDVSSEGGEPFNICLDEPFNLSLFRAEVTELPDMLTEECFPVRESWEDQRVELQRSFSTSAMQTLRHPFTSIEPRSAASVNCLNLNYDRLIRTAINADVIASTLASQSHSLNWLANKNDSGMSIENRMMRPQSMPVHIDDSSNHYLYGIDSSVLPISEKSVSAEDFSIMKNSSSKIGLCGKIKSISLDSSKFNNDDDNEVTPENVFGGGPASPAWSQCEESTPREQWDTVPLAGSRAGNAMGSSNTLVMTQKQTKTTAECATQVDSELELLNAPAQHTSANTEINAAQQQLLDNKPSLIETNVSKQQVPDNKSSVNDTAENFLPAAIEKPRRSINLGSTAPNNEIRQLLAQALSMIQQTARGPVVPGAVHILPQLPEVGYLPISIQDGESQYKPANLIPAQSKPTNLIPGYLPITLQDEESQSKPANLIPAQSKPANLTPGYLPILLQDGESQSKHANLNQLKPHEIKSPYLSESGKSSLSPINIVSSTAEVSNGAEMEFNNDSQIDSGSLSENYGTNKEQDEDIPHYVLPISTLPYMRNLNRWESEEILNKRLYQLRHANGNSDPMLAKQNRFFSQQILNDQFGSQRTIETQTYPEVRVIETQTKPDDKNTAIAEAETGSCTQTYFGSNLQLVDTGVGPSPPVSPPPFEVNIIEQLEVYAIPKTDKGKYELNDELPVMNSSKENLLSVGIQADEPWLLPLLDLSSTDEDNEDDGILTSEVAKMSAVEYSSLKVPRMQTKLPPNRPLSEVPANIKSSEPSLEELRKEHEKFMKVLEQSKGDRAQARARRKEQMKSRQRQFQEDRASVSSHDCGDSVFSPNAWDSMSSLVLSPIELTDSAPKNTIGSSPKLKEKSAPPDNEDENRKRPIQLIINVEREREVIIQGSVPARIVKHSELSLEDIENDSLAYAESVLSPVHHSNAKTLAEVQKSSTNYKTSANPDQLTYDAASKASVLGGNLSNENPCASKNTKSGEKKQNANSLTPDNYSKVSNNFVIETNSSTNSDGEGYVYEEPIQTLTSYQHMLGQEQPPSENNSNRSESETTAKAFGQSKKILKESVRADLDKTEYSDLSRLSTPTIKSESRSQSTERSEDGTNSTDAKRIMQKYEQIRRLVDEIERERPLSRTSIGSGSVYEASEANISVASSERRSDSPQKRVHFHPGSSGKNSRRESTSSTTSVLTDVNSVLNDVDSNDEKIISKNANITVKEMRETAIETDKVISDDQSELDRLRRERERIRAMLAKDLLPSRSEVESAEAQLNYLIGQTDVLLTSLDEPWESDILERMSYFDPEAHLSATTRAHLEKYRASLQKSERVLDERIRLLEKKTASSKHRGSHYTGEDKFSKMKKEAMYDAFKRERGSEQARHNIMHSTLSRKSGGDLGSRHYEPLPDTYMTALERAQYFADIRKDLFNPRDDFVDQSSNFSRRLQVSDMIRDEIDNTLAEVYGTRSHDQIESQIRNSRWSATGQYVPGDVGRIGQQNYGRDLNSITRDSYSNRTGYGPGYGRDAYSASGDPLRGLNASRSNIQSNFSSSQLDNSRLLAQRYC